MLILASVLYTTEHTALGEVGLDTTGLLNYGVLGIFSGILLYISRMFLKREQTRADAEHAENIRLNTLIQSNQAQIIPAMLAATQAISASQALLTQIQRDLDVDQTARAMVGKILAQEARSNVANE